MRNSRYIKRNNIAVIISLCLLLFILYISFFRLNKSSAKATNSKFQTWKIQSIDTMKTSRDKAREKLYSPEYDKQILIELIAIKETGANYVAIDTPYDKEFLPYLKRWVTLARKTELKVWFRGNWSSWEGWFDYEKNMSPEEHLTKTYRFIQDNASLFEDGDIFDACPECENAGHWTQPENDKEYNIFLQKQKINNQHAFNKIGKKVYSNIASVIGGRAKEVLDQETLNTLENVVAIDHYIQDPSSMGKYIDYFYKNYNTRVLVSEFGAPIPDLHGEMTEKEQANFVESLFEELYKKNDAVVGANYNVLILGTSSLLNEDYSPREVYKIVKKYYSPGVIKGRVTNSLGDVVKEINIKTSDGKKTRTDQMGNYLLTVPQRTIILNAGGGEYKVDSQMIMIKKNGEEIVKNFVVDPIRPGIIFRLRLFIKNL